MNTALRAALLALAALAAETAPSHDLSPPLSENDSDIQVPPLLATLQRDAPRTTVTSDGVAGDPLNVALVGTREQLQTAFCMAGWYPADPVTLRSSIGITLSVIFNIPYPQAPLSSLYLWGRSQDLAFEQPCGKSARRRHHVRLWCSGVGPDGKPVWLGADTFNVSVGRSERNGRVTHHIDPDVDSERDKLMNDLFRTGLLATASLLPWTEPTEARNGGGDPYFTDGNMAVGTLHEMPSGVEVSRDSAPVSSSTLP